MGPARTTDVGQVDAKVPTEHTKPRPSRDTPPEGLNRVRATPEQTSGRVRRPAIATCGPCLAPALPVRGGVRRVNTAIEQAPPKGAGL